MKFGGLAENKISEQIICNKYLYNLYDMRNKFVLSTYFIEKIQKITSKYNKFQ